MKNYKKNMTHEVKQVANLCSGGIVHDKILGGTEFVT